MSTSRSDRAATAALLAAAATLGLAVLFHLVQNRGGITGGSVAWPKSLWLGIALLYWLVLPSVIVVDPVFTDAQRQPFRWLLLLMGARALAEPWMLYVAKNWSPNYGIAHDALCLAVMWLFALRLQLGCGARSGGAHRLATWHCFFTGALFLPEMHYADYMRKHFVTQGERPIYFVPDDGLHVRLLAITAAVDALALAWLALYLFLRSERHADRQAA